MTLNKTNQNVYIEHANITVNNTQKSVIFFTTAFPHFKVRGGDEELKQWLHLGDDYTYVALQQEVEGLGSKFSKNYDKIGINHMAFVVSNISEVTDRLLKAGYKIRF